jgi:hypothetical protein
MLTAQALKIGARYNWKGQPERLVYIGSRFYPGDRRCWHQFAKTDDTDTVWSEVLGSDLSHFEETTTQGEPQ